MGEPAVPDSEPLHWSTSDVIDHVHHAHPDGYLPRERARPSITAIPTRFGFARYHRDEASSMYARLDSEVLNGHGFEAGFLMMVRPQFLGPQFKIAAHATAAAQSLDCLPDILAHAVYFALQIDQDDPPKSPKELGHGDVLRRVNKRPEWAAIGSALSAMTAGKPFKHLHALVNRSKHCDIVRPAIHFRTTDDGAEPYALEFEAFEHQVARSRPPERFERVRVLDLLDPEFERLSIATAETVYALCEWLGTQAAERGHPLPSLLTQRARVIANLSRPVSQ